MGDCYLAWNHCSFEHEFESLCKDKGYVVVDLSYHHNYKEEVMRELRKDFSPTSLSVRLAPDMMISKEGKTIFCELILLKKGFYSHPAFIFTEEDSLTIVLSLAIQAT